MNQFTYENLEPREKVFIDQVIAIKEKTRAKFSGYKVGAVVVTPDGKSFAGCNVETATYETTHAERNAIDTMIAGGEETISKIFVATKDGGVSCGACRQVIWEFSGSKTDLPIYLVDEQKNIKLTTIGELLPYPFPQPAAKIT